MMFIVLLIILIIVILYKWKCTDVRENASFLLDQLNVNIPRNPEIINEIESRGNYRVVAIDSNVKLDKNGRVEYITYAKPHPESGESECYRVSCPSWVTNIACWKCL